MRTILPERPRKPDSRRSASVAAPPGARVPAPDPSAWARVFLDSWHPHAWILALACLLYLPTLGFGFSPLDDRWLVLQRIDRWTDLSELPRVFTRALFDHSYYRPLLALSFVIDASAGDGSPLPFHLTNVLLHGLASVLVLTCLAQLGLSRVTAWALAALFAVHPVHVHAVAWIPGRNDVLLAVFVLCATITLVGFLRAPGAARLLLHLSFVALALLTKETAVVLPAVLLARGLVGGMRKNGLALLAGGWLAVLALWFTARSGIVSDVTALGQGDLAQIGTDAASALVVYCGKLVVPVQQAVFPHVPDSSLVPGILVLLAGLALVAWKGVVDRRKALCGAIWFLGFLVLPLLHGSSNGIGEHYEHRLYLPSIGALIALSQIDLASWIESRRARRVAAAGLAVVVGLLFVKTVVRSTVYRSEASLAEAGVRESPGLYFAYLVRGDVRSDAGAYDAAAADFQRAFERMPEFAAARAEGHAHLAATLARQGRTAESVEHYREAVRLGGGEAEQYNNLGNGLARLGHLDEAAAHYEQALRMRPEFAEAHNNLGVVLVRMSRFEQGLREFEAALRIDPDYTGARQNLERTLRLLDRPGDGTGRRP